MRNDPYVTGNLQRFTSRSGPQRCVRAKGNLWKWCSMILLGQICWSIRFDNSTDALKFWILQAGKTCMQRPYNYKMGIRMKSLHVMGREVLENCGV